MYNHKHKGTQHCEGQVQRMREDWVMLPPEIIKSGLMTSLVTIMFPDSEEKQYGSKQT